MSMPPDPDRRLSEISHLFLSSVRDRHTMGRPSPRRTPPGTTGAAPARRSGDGSSDVWSPPGGGDALADALADLARVPPPESAAAPAPAGQGDAVDEGHDDSDGEGGDHPDGGDQSDDDARVIDGDRLKPLAAIVGPHLHGGLLDAARQYAGHRAASGRRVGMIHLDAAAPGGRADAAVRLMSFEADGDGTPLGDSDADLADALADDREGDSDGASAPRGDAASLAEALVEMDCDVDEWLLVVADPDAPRARRALAAACRWVVPTTADHDGVVGAYRSIKSLLAPASPAAPSADRDGPAYDDAFLTPPGLGGNAGLLDGSPQGPPAVSLVVLDAVTPAHAGRVHRKVAGACGQFLSIALRAEPPAAFNAHVAELPVLTCGGGRGSDCWDVLADFVESGRDADAEARQGDEALAPSPGGEDADDGDASGEGAFSRPARGARPATAAAPDADVTLAPTAAGEPTRFRPARAAGRAPQAGRLNVGCRDALPIHRSVADAATSDATDTPMHPFDSTAPAPTASVPADAPLAAPTGPDPLRLPATDKADAADTVLDLPAGASASCVISAVMAAPGSDLAACPVAPPVLPSGTVAVGRDGRLVLMAAMDGPASLPPTMAAFRWLAENRRLLAMALPQFRVDADLEPQLRLHVDHARRAELSAESLRPLLRDETVTVRTYRTLKWGGRTGLLLEAA